MINLSFITLFIFWQAPAREPEWTDFAGTIIMAAVLGFFGGSLLTAIFFLATRSEKSRNSFNNQPINNPNEKRIDIKHCPQCNSTYTDEDLSYCLRDGTLLKIVGTMPALKDPDETVVSSKFNPRA